MERAQRGPSVHRTVTPDISPSCETLTGYTAQELMDEPRHFFRLIHPDDRERVRTLLDALEGEPTGTWQDEYRIVHRDGSVRWFRGFGQRTTPARAYPAVWQGITFDVTHLHPPEPLVEGTEEHLADLGER